MADQNGNNGGGSGTTVESILRVLLGQLEKISKAETVCGAPIVADKTTIIPVSKVTIGFAAGGSDAGGEVGTTHRRGTISIGGTGGGITVEPVAFIVVTPDGKPQLLPMKSSINQVSQAISLLPEAISKIAALRGGGNSAAASDKVALPAETEKKKRPSSDE
jgi:uncharacterized spore protein YtfJ